MRDSVDVPFGQVVLEDLKQTLSRTQTWVEQKAYFSNNLAYVNNLMKLPLQNFVQA